MRGAEVAWLKPLRLRRGGSLIHQFGLHQGLAQGFNLNGTLTLL